MRFSKKTILRKLREMYPNAGPQLHFSNPYETLIAVMLSAQCTDKQVNKVTPALFERYPDVAAMAKAQVSDVYPMVKSCGFKSKAENIVSACRMIVEKYGGVIPQTMEELTMLPGVGRKTANVVMATAFHIPAIAVDTHVFRVSNRLGLAEAEDVLKTELQLRESIPEKDWCDAHHWLIFHGRQVCHARGPECERCALSEYCRYYQKHKE